MREIPLTRGYVALVDDCDWELVARYRWHAAVYKNTTYAKCTRRGRTLFMHRLLLNPPCGTLVDHANSNGLDNRRANIRLCTFSQNKQNTPKPRLGTGRFKGACWSKERKAWHSYIYADRIRHNVGFFDSDEEAARAYDEAAIRLHGEFARLNFPLESQAA